MSRVYLLQRTQRLPVSLERAWAFFADPANLLALTPPFLNLRVTNLPYGGRMYPGQVITYRVRPLLGIPLFWLTEITHVEPMRRFVDEQRLGPYRLWHHEHHFIPIEGGVEMTDVVHYALPLGPLGRLAHGLVVRRKLQQIFAFRRQKVEELFGHWEGEPS